MLFSSGPLLWQDVNCGREGPLFSPLFFQLSFSPPRAARARFLFPRARDRVFSET
jgi:hypothetical protein